MSCSPRRCRSIIVVLVLGGGFFLSLRSMAKLGIVSPHAETSKPDLQVTSAEKKDFDRSQEKRGSSDKPQSEKKVVSLPPNTPQRYKKDAPALKRYLEYLAKDDELLPKPSRAVIIITNHRSGSSFFGELFNQHPDAFYLFEPLFPLSNSSQCELRRDLKIKILKEFVQCSLPDWNVVYKDIPIREQYVRRANMRACVVDGVCFRMNTKELCEDRHCPRTSPASVRSCRYECGAVNKRLVDNDCRRKSLVALKIIRVCDIRNMEEIISALPVDIKILHLVRDPRGIANSRVHILRQVDLNVSMHGTCTRLQQNLQAGLVNTPPWLKGKYMVVRYEDVAMHPYDIARSVYDFVGLNFPKMMLQWIANNTGIPMPSVMESSPVVKQSELEDVKSLEKRAVEPVPEKISRRKRYDPYGTSRDSAKVVQKWVNQLSYSSVRVVEDTCADFMKMAGYVTVGDKESYKRNKSIKYFLSNITLQMELD